MRLHVFAEGPTEAGFFERVLSPHLWNHGVFSHKPALTATSRRAGASARGGVLRYEPFRDDIVRWIRRQEGHEDVRFTTMIDLYALPDDFPGYKEASRLSSPPERVACLERELAKDVGSRAFLPYIQLHEFEALLFVEPEKFSDLGIAPPRGIAELREIADRFQDPEWIDGEPSGAPSKRIIRAIPRYAKLKPHAGPLVAEAIGLPALRARCAHFGAWVASLERLATPASSVAAPRP